MINIIAEVKPLKHIIHGLEKIIGHINDILAKRTTHWIIIGIGVILRVAQFSYNRSLTEAEAPVAMNIIHRSYKNLLQPLDYIQPAPVGFSIIEKFIVQIFGNSEYALRLFPLIAGILALFLFYEIARKTVGRNTLGIALILFTVSDHLIYFASEVKQYSSDVAINLLIIILAYNLFEKYRSIKFILFGIVSAIAIWFSHPAVFTVSAVMIVLFIALIKKREWENLIWLFVAGLITLASLVINFGYALQLLGKDKDLLEGFARSFMPLSCSLWSNIKWLGYVFLRSFKNPLGLSIYELFLAVLSFFIGIFALFYKEKKKLLVLVLPIILTIVASAFKKYPFEGRLLLFIAPLMILVTAEGINFIREKSSEGSRIIGFAFVLILLVQPIGLAGYHVIKPRAPEELRPVINYLKANQEPADIIYLYYPTVKAFQYYAEKFGYTESDYLVSPESQYDWTNYYKSLVKLEGKKRVWILFSHVITWHGADEEKLFLSFLDLLGTRLDAFQTQGASIYLYDLSAETR